MGLVSFLSTLPSLLPIAPSRLPLLPDCPFMLVQFVAKLKIMFPLINASAADTLLIPLGLPGCHWHVVNFPWELIASSSSFIQAKNKGLSGALNLLEDAKKEIDSYSKGGPISYSDLIQLAAQSAMKASFLAAAIRKCGGNEEKGNLLYSAYGSTRQWGLFDRNFGRSDTQEPDPEGRVPQWE